MTWEDSIAAERARGGSAGQELQKESRPHTGAAKDALCSSWGRQGRGCRRSIRDAAKKQSN